MSSLNHQIETPDDPQLEALCQQLQLPGKPLRTPADWPAQSLALCARHGVNRWFIESRWGGLDWAETDVVCGYLKLSSACLTTTFIITQFVAACRRIAMSQDDDLKSELLPALASGQAFATVGISHLTTSRRHLANPVLVADRVEGGWKLNGYSPWVTGGQAANQLVVGASLHDASQVLLVVPMDLKGIRVEPGFELVGLSASHTGKVSFDDVFVPDSRRIAGPGEDIMASPGAGSTGGLQTSTLALGLSLAAIRFLQKQVGERPELDENAAALQGQFDYLRGQLLNAAEGNPSCSRETLRTESNSLVLRSTQSALVAAKGAGYVEGHPVGRWCREALFFLVWSCPQGVAQANLCELAGLES